MAIKTRGPGVALVPATSPEQAFKGIAVLGSQQFNIPDEADRLEVVTPDELAREKNDIIPDAHAESFCITHPNSYMVPQLPAHSRSWLRRNNIHSIRPSIMGRIADIDVDQSINPDNKGARHEIAVVNEAYTTAELVMQADVDVAKKNKTFSIYDPIMETTRDTWNVWQYDRNVQRYDGQLGEWVLRAVLSPDAHPEDIYIEFADPVEGKDTADDHYNYHNAYVDTQAYAAGERPKFTGEYAQLNNPDSTLSRQFINGLSRSYLDPNWNYKREKRKNLSKTAKKVITTTRQLIGNHQGSTAEPLRAYLRTAELLQEYDELEKERPKGKTAIKAERQRVWQSMLSVRTYLDKLRLTEKFDKASLIFLHEKDEDWTLPMTSCVRFEVLALDDIDTKISAKAREAQKMKTAYDYSDRDREILDELVEHLGGDKRGRHNSLIIRTLGGSAIRLLETLSPDASKGSEMDKWVYNGTGKPYSMAGHHADESIASLYNPNVRDKKYFRARGNAMGGIAIAFEVLTPEREADPTKKGQDNDRFMITSSKGGPNCVTEDIYKTLGKTNRSAEDMYKLLDGSTKYSHIYTRKHKETWRVATNSPSARRMHLHPKRFQNGSSFVLAYRNDGTIYSDVGTYPRQRPVERQMGERRYAHKERYLDKAPLYGDKLTGDLPILADAAKNEPYRDADGNVVKKDNRLAEVAFVHGTVRIMDTPTDSVSVHTQKEFRKLRLPTKRRWVKKGQRNHAAA